MKKTGKKERQAMVEETARVYQSFTRDTMDGFWVVDMKGNFLDVNGAYCRLIGYSRSELLKMNVAAVEAIDKPKDIAKRIQQLKKRGKARFFTQHRKKNGQVIDFEISANYTSYSGGMIFVFLRDVTERNKAEAEKAAYRASMRKMLETQLADSYKHLGSINRKISLLLEIGKYPISKKYRQGIIDHILNLAMNISNAPTGYLYGSKGKGKFDLLSYKGIKENQKEKIKEITTRTVGLLRHLLKEKNIVSGNIKRYEAKLLALDNKLEYFVTLPLSKGNALSGFIFLGFNRKKNVEKQDLEFLDVFALHASSALSKAGILK
jgi:PAS domain S-box-containing protein